MDSVIMGELWPSLRLIVRMSIPDAINMLACVCRRLCSVTPFMPIDAIATGHAFVTALGL